MTLLHSIFDAMIASSLGVAFFWPFTSVRYNLPWHPRMDVPMVFSASCGILGTVVFILLLSTG